MTGLNCNVNRKYEKQRAKNQGIPLLDGHFIEEAIVGRRSEAEMATIMPFRRLSKNMGRRMPEYPLAFRMFKVQELEFTRFFEGSIQIPQSAIHLRSTLKKGILDAIDCGMAYLGNDDAFRETLRHLLSDVHRARFPALCFSLGTIGHGDGDFLSWLG